MSDSKDEPVKPTQPQESEDFGDERISYPTLELYRHTILRGANLGSVVSLIGGPIYLLIRGVRSPKELLRRTGSITAKGTVAGILFGIVMTHMRIRKDEKIKVYDRCYRLRYNEGQVRTDKFSYGGLVLGAAGGAAAGLGSSPFMGGIHGASMGVGLAVLAHVLTKPKSQKEEEKKEEKKDKA